MVIFISIIYKTQFFKKIAKYIFKINLITMAKAKTSEVRSFRKKSSKKRPGVHSKKNTSRHKASRNYKKSYKGQGR